MNGRAPCATLGLSLSITLACTPQGGDETETGSTTGETATGSTTGETASETGATSPTSTTGLECPQQVDSCGCFELVEGSLTRRCATVDVCDRINIACPEANSGYYDCAEDTLTVQNPAALTCTLQAMRDRTPGRLQWLLTPDGDDDDNAYWNREVQLFVADDDSAFVVENEDIDLSASYEDLRRIPLPAAEILDLCLTQEPRAQFTCLRDALAAAAQEVCIPKFSGSVHGTINECASGD